MTFIFLLLFICIFGVLLFISMMKGIASFLFGKAGGVGSKKYTSDYSNQHTQTKASQAKKVFGKNEGEYVNYEEIKD